jgi:ADP-ribose pyrophosphatase YjhB (NUDIX family)
MEWGKFDKGVFLVNVLGIVYNPETRKVLIGRRENDPHLKELGWCFPGGRPAHEDDLEAYLKHEVRIKTGLDVEVKGIVFAKSYPENRKLLSIYYYCEAREGGEKAEEKLVEVRWVKPAEVRDYFTTSLHPKLLDFLRTLE